ncbi:MAG TPA: gamma-glutamyl-gamma-aminobutyrate hydrolase family protein [Candidatus Sulfotelmatobacter sp.]|nr:gamma-glutamyl-gamma-aminobutyrate hydrolase family protein [Candidatus Sulfotelmatobacter sp.]
MKAAPVRIAISMPHSTDPEYAERAIPQYERAVALIGGEPVRISLDQTPDDVLKLMETCSGLLLPGSNADVDPSKFKQERSPHTAAADERRQQVDEFLLDHAYRQRKPVLGICYGLQSLNVFHAGSLVQHIPDFLPEEKRTRVNHEAGKKVPIAHTVEIDRDSLLAQIVCGDSRLGRPSKGAAERDLSSQIRTEHSEVGLIGVEIGQDREGRSSKTSGETSGFYQGTALSRSANAAEGEQAFAPERALIVAVNSSHHQSADAIGTGLRIVARCAEDGIIEALEGTAPDHFVLAVQWHPERSVEDDQASRSIFEALMTAARQRQ